MMSQFSVITDVINERTRQNLKYGEQNHNAFRWLSILTEEVGEAAQAVNNAWESLATSPAEIWGQWQAYREELIQVAAVAVAMIECLDRNRKQPEE